MLVCMMGLGVGVGVVMVIIILPLFPVPADIYYYQAVITTSNFQPFKNTQNSISIHPTVVSVHV